MDFVIKDGKRCIVDNDGKELTPFVYDSVFPMIELSHDNMRERIFDGLINVMKDGKWGLLDNTGREVTLLKYDLPVYFFEGLAVVSVNGKDGYIDQTGREITPIIYDEAYGYRPDEGVMAVVLDGRELYLNREGEVVSEGGVVDRTSYFYDISTIDYFSHYEYYRYISGGDKPEVGLRVLVVDIGVMIAAESIDPETGLFQGSMGMLREISEGLYVEDSTEEEFYRLSARRMEWTKKEIITKTPPAPHLPPGR